MKKLLFLLVFIPLISFGQTAEEDFYEGLLKFENGDYYGAIYNYTRALETDTTVSLYHNIARSKDLLNDKNGAFKDYNKAIYFYKYKTDTTSQKIYSIEYSYHYRGIILDYYKDFKKAIEDQTSAIEINPDYAEAYFYRALAKSELKDYYGAMSDYTKVIELDPNNTSAYYNRGNAKYNLKDYYGAISDYTKAIELDPNDDLYYSRGLAKSNLKDHYGAIADYTKAIELNPNYTNAYANRGIAKELIGDLNGACEDWKKAASLGHTNSKKWVANQCN